MPCGPESEYGLDTLAYGFPQNDPGKLAGLQSYLHTTNKPHSVYLGIAYGLGLPALLVFAALVLIVLWRHEKAIWSGIALDPVHLALLAGWLAILAGVLDLPGRHGQHAPGGRREGAGGARRGPQGGLRTGPIR